MAKQPSEFKKLKELWYKKLRDSGFTDIEYSNESLKTVKRSDHFTRKRAQTQYGGFERKRDYYYLANHFLNEHAFEKELHKVIWEYHTNGISIRKITDLLTGTKIIKINRTTVWAIIKNLKTIMNKMYLSK